MNRVIRKMIAQTITQSYGGVRVESTVSQCV